MIRGPAPGRWRSGVGTHNDRLTAVGGQHSQMAWWSGVLFDQSHILRVARCDCQTPARYALNSNHLSRFQSRALRLPSRLARPPHTSPSCVNRVLWSRPRPTPLIRPVGRSSASLGSSAGPTNACLATPWRPGARRRMFVGQESRPARSSGSGWLAAVSMFDLAEYVERSTAASDVPVFLTDPGVVRELARLVSAAMRSRRPPAGSASDPCRARLPSAS